MKPKIKIDAGDVYGHITVIEELPSKIYPNGKRERMVRCKCICGKIIEVFMWNMIKRRKGISCGCKAREKNSIMMTVHGLTNHSLHHRWCGMRNRCYLPSATFYKDYGGRGIKVCDEWMADFQSFYDWAMANGYKKELEIDRVDNNGDYSPSNCRWVTKKQNCNNRRSSNIYDYNGEKITLRELSKKISVRYSTLYRRVAIYKMTVEEAVLNEDKRGEKRRRLKYED